MTNEEKVREIIGENCKKENCLQCGGKYSAEKNGCATYQKIMQMAKWKDEQIGVLNGQIEALKKQLEKSQDANVFYFDKANMAESKLKQIVNYADAMYTATFNLDLIGSGEILHKAMEDYKNFKFKEIIQ